MAPLVSECDITRENREASRRTESRAMTIRKFSYTDIISVEIAGSPTLRKDARAHFGASEVFHKVGHRTSFDYQRRPGFLYVNNRAISSRTNMNFDTWPAAEISTTEPGLGYRTFIGKPVFVEHANDNHHKTRGVNVAATLHEDYNPDGTPDTWVELLKEIDANKYPKLTAALLNKKITRTSMGVDCRESVCSRCGNVAEDPSSYCKHLPLFKGARYEFFNPTTLRKEQRLVHEICKFLVFFEDTFIVTQPADPTAFILGVQK